jgi:hypothetical protein
MKKSMKILWWVVILFCVSGGSRSLAETSCMRCERGKKLVCIGTPASVVLAKCGEPLSIVEIGSKKRTRGDGTITKKGTKENNDVYRTRPKRSSTTLKLEEWTYCTQESYGSDCYLYILRFEGDTLTKITSTLEKGN